VRRPGGGSGLGLAIALAIARAHGGDLEATNRPPGGARLRFTVPVAELSSNLHHGLAGISSPAHTVGDDPTTSQGGTP
jgi:nitrogen-specific signal transduction histidine kinase